MQVSRAAEPILKLEDVSVSLGGRPLVEHVSLSVAPGEIVGIIGPNGGGKTTLVKAILGLLPHSGSITIEAQRGIGYVPQYFDFDRSLPLTVRELFRVRFGGSPFNSRFDQESQHLLASVGAKHIWERQLGVLSGGELQRALLALAQTRHPDLLLLDEPSSGIDIGGEETIYNLIKRLADEQGLTIVFISHDMDVVYRYATQVICLNRHMTCAGPPSKVLTDENLAHLHSGLTKPFPHHRHNP